MVNFGKIHVGDVNTDFQVLCEETNDIGTINTVINLASTTAWTIVLTKPDGTVIEKTGRIVNPPGSDGIVGWINSSSTFIDVGGFWTRSAKLTFNDGGVFETNPIIFQVLSNAN